MRRQYEPLNEAEQDQLLTWTGEGINPKQITRLINAQREKDGRTVISYHTIRKRLNELQENLPYEPEPCPEIGRCATCFEMSAVALRLGTWRLCRRCADARSNSQSG